MRATKTQVEKITLRDVDNLDPITIVIDDIGPGSGSIVICCFGKAWTAYWGGMGQHSIAEFFTSSHVQYLADRLSTIDAQQVDYEAISERIGECVDVTTALTYSDQLVDAYGPDWYHDLPMCANPDYTYLCRVIRAVQEGLSTDLQQPTEKT